MPTLDEIFDHPIPRAGGQPGSTTLRAFLAYWDANNDTTRKMVKAVPGQVLTAPVADPNDPKHAPRVVDWIVYGNLKAGKAADGVAGVPAAVLAQKFKLVDGTVTDLASILSAINAKPVTTGGTTNIQPADPLAVATAVVNAITAGVGIQITKK